MYDTYVTFDFCGITDVDGIEITDCNTAAERFVYCLARAARDSGWSEYIAHAIVRETPFTTVVRLVLTEEVSRAHLCGLLQHHLYDEGCLEGGFTLGVLREFTVTLLVPQEFTVKATSVDAAVEKALAANKGARLA
jgi:hypothetical protein